MGDFMYILKSLARASVWVVAMLGLREIVNLTVRVLAP